MRFDNLERIPYGPVDPEVVLLRVEDANGRARALLEHYAAQRGRARPHQLLTFLYDMLGMWKDKPGPR